MPSDAKQSVSEFWRKLKGQRIFAFYRVSREVYIAFTSLKRLSTPRNLSLGLHILNRCYEGGNKHSVKLEYNLFAQKRKKYWRLPRENMYEPVYYSLGNQKNYFKLRNISNKETCSLTFLVNNLLRRIKDMLISSQFSVRIIWKTITFFSSNFWLSSSLKFSS